MRHQLKEMALELETSDGVLGYLWSNQLKFWTFQAFFGENYLVSRFHSFIKAKNVYWEMMLLFLLVTVRPSRDSSHKLTQPRSILNIAGSRKLRTANQLSYLPKIHWNPVSLKNWLNSRNPVGLHEFQSWGESQKKSGCRITPNRCKGVQSISWPCTWSKRNR